jgi:23S rRNA (pseudouridine1915-N3)-methyltransferase
MDGRLATAPLIQFGRDGPLVSHRGGAVRIVLVCVGRLRGSPFADDVAHYERLLSRYARLETSEVRDAGAEASRRQEAVAREAELILARMPSGTFMCALDREGETLTSTALADWLEQRRQAGRDVCFVLGGAFGLDTSVLERADQRLSLGPLTLPHLLARVVLLEQLFRAHKILAREPYHY